MKLKSKVNSRRSKRYLPLEPLVILANSNGQMFEYILGRCWRERATAQRGRQLL